MSNHLWNCYLQEKTALDETSFKLQHYSVMSRLSKISNLDSFFLVAKLASNIMELAMLDE
jgi:hypothetical protein